MLRRWLSCAAISLASLLVFRSLLEHRVSHTRVPWATTSRGNQSQPWSFGVAAPVTQAARVLVTSEQHLQRVGSDRRLLALLRTLRGLNAQASLLVRTRRCGQCRHDPPIQELAALLGSTSSTAVMLQPGERPAAPPAIYEYGGSLSLVALLDTAAFDLVLVGLWFWYDPQPSFAELLVPVIRAHAESIAGNAGVQGPLIGVLTDDAHAERARRLAEEETDPRRKHAFRTQTRNYAMRQRALYSEVDGVFYLTDLDRAAEEQVRRTAVTSQAAAWRRGRESGALHAALLRMTVTPDALVKNDMLAPRTSMSSPEPWIGFVGDGHTATNSLGVQRFIREGWPYLRSHHPRVRLRLVGRIPTGHRAGTGERRGGKEAACREDEHSCGWAAATPCFGREASCGIDSLGYLSDGELLAETRRWSILLVPIFATTGANTKLLLGLQLGLPIISTIAAALPFGLVEQQSGQRPNTTSSDGLTVQPASSLGMGKDEAPPTLVSAALGSSSMELAKISSRLLGDPDEAARLAAAGRAHFVRLVRSTVPTEDAAAMLGWVSRTKVPSVKELASPYVNDVWPRTVKAPELLWPIRQTRLTGRDAGVSGGICWMNTSFSSFATVQRTVSRCGLAALWPGAWLLDTIWLDLCRKCAWQCINGSEMSGPGTHERSAPSQVGSTPRLRMLSDCDDIHIDKDDGMRVESASVHFAWEPASVRDLYHYQGSALSAVVRSERVVARLARSCAGPLPPTKAPDALPSSQAPGLEYCERDHRHALTVRIDRMQTEAGWRFAWMAAFGMVLGIRPIDASELVRSVAGPHKAHILANLRARALHRPGRIKA